MFGCRGDRKQARRDLDFGYEGHLGPQSYQPWQIQHYYLVSNHFSLAENQPEFIALNHISAHFLIPLLDSSLICTVPAQ